MASSHIASLEKENTSLRTSQHSTSSSPANVCNGWSGYCQLLCHLQVSSRHFRTNVSPSSLSMASLQSDHSLPQSMCNNLVVISITEYPLENLTACNKCTYFINIYTSEIRAHHLQGHLDNQDTCPWSHLYQSTHCFVCTIGQVCVAIFRCCHWPVYGRCW